MSGFQTRGLHIFPHMERVAFMDEPEGWRELQEKALDETDPKRLIEIMDQLVSMLAAHEKRVASNSATSDLRQPEGSPDAV
jgi:hypothetical protein